jgi:hypothetical protein
MDKSTIFTGCPQHGARLSKDMRYEVRCAICAAKAIANLCDYIAALEVKLFEEAPDDVEEEIKPGRECVCNHMEIVHRPTGSDGHLECYKEVGSYYCRCSEFKPKEQETERKPICVCGHWRERHVGNTGICMQESCACVGFK